jgi:Flp pilus assembly protein TadG
MTFAAFRRNQEGASAVEFALLAVPFFLMLFGIVEGGRLLWTQLGLQHAVEMAARCSSLATSSNPNPCPGASVQSYAASQAYGLNPPSDVFSVLSADCGSEVTATYTFVFITSYFGTSPLSLTARSCAPH